jgi:signal transduction histidine kinase
VRALAAVLAVSVLGGSVALFGWALAGARRAETARHAEVAQRVVDAMEAELSDLLAREESRSFLEYRSYYVPTDNSGLGTVARSPLAGGELPPWLIGHFQVDPSGEVTSPLELRPSEQALAELDGWSPPENAARRLAELRQLVEGVDVWAAASLASRVADARMPVPRPSGPVDKLNSLGSAQRLDRSVQSQKVGGKNVAVYQAQEVPLMQTVDDRLGAGELDAFVTPFQGARTDDRLVLVRTVRLDGQTLQQGFVVDLPALRDHLERAVVHQAGLHDVVQLGFDGEQPEGRWVFSHRFAPPFASLDVSVGLWPIGGVQGWEQGLLQGLALLLLALWAVVGAALAFAVRAELRYARQRNDFVAAVSHELKTPLTSIRMYAEMLRDGMVPDSQRQQLYHATITAESERLSRLIDNVLELSRMEQGTPRPEPVVGDLAEVVDEAVSLLSAHAAAHEVQLRVHREGELPPVRIDRDGLVQVLVNLVDNAVKFGGPGQVELVLRPVDGGAVVEVRDHGPGVPADQLRAIFEPFYRGERELTRTTKGTGIGLALVRSLVQGMGGAVKAAAAPDGGLTVSVRLAGAG